MRDIERDPAIAEIVELAAMLVDVPRSVERLRAGVGLGYPAGGGSGSRSASGNSSVENALRLDSEETGAVTAFDPFDAKLRELDRAIKTAREALRRVRDIVRWSMPPKIADRLPDDAIWCRNHRRIGAREPIYSKSVKSGLCEWCWSFHQNHGRLPTPRLLEIHAVRKVTQRDIEAEGIRPPVPAEREAS